MEVSPGFREFDKFAIPVSPESSEESSINPFSQDWIQEQVPEAAEFGAATDGKTGEKPAGKLCNLRWLEVVSEFSNSPEKWPQSGRGTRREMNLTRQGLNHTL